MNYRSLLEGEYRMKTILSEIMLGDMTCRFYTDGDGKAEMVVFPASMKEKVAEPKGNIDSMIQLKLEGDAFPYGFANGHTMRNSGTLDHITFSSQSVEEDENTITIRTFFENPYCMSVAYVVEYVKSEQGLRIHTELKNTGDEVITLEMLSSFSVGGLTPFAEDEATGHLLIHRLRSKWSNEGRLETIPAEDLQLEPSWSGWGVNSEKFGEVGSFPVRRFFPMVMLEDQEEHVVWACELGCASSWMMEVYRRDDNLCISGGLPDFDFGHWKKNLITGEVFVTPTAYLTVCEGTVMQACQRLTSMQEKTPEHDRLPVIFNEYCTSWGNPTEESILHTLSALKGMDIEYFVIDAGWYADKVYGWERNIGDWIVAEHLFPSGLETTVQNIRNAGMKPGIWFELEAVGEKAEVYGNTEHLLKRNGKVITSGARRFWDMRDLWTKAYLQEKVIGFLQKYGFEYIKIDYNESIGVGCDGAESLGEGLRQNILATQEFFRKIHERVPGIKIELCASGGHRLEPSMLNLTEYASFSDAHEELEIPVIAANLHRAVRPEKSQIWAVIRKKDSIQRIVYSVANTFLGVMCLSGDVTELREDQWEAIRKGIAFYRKIRHITADGTSEIYGPAQKSYRKLKDYQAVLRRSLDGTQAVLLVHAFELDENSTVSVPVDREWRIADVYEADSHEITLQDGELKIKLEKSYDAVAVWLA